jgi:predicted acetyltransferase
MAAENPPRVVVPDPAWRDAFLRMLDDYSAHEDPAGDQFAEAREDFSAYAAHLLDEERGVGLPEGFVPCSHRWLIDGHDEIVGVVRVRHSIDHPLLRREGGHIGYDVPPSQRGQGRGTTALEAGLARSRELGLDRVLVCAAADNAASCRVVERCGGQLDEEFFSDAFGCRVRRYWIETAG